MNSSVRSCISAVVLSAASMAFAATVNYTGNGTEARMISDPANWDGTVDETADLVVRDIRARYDGVRRNPFDEAECGHHYSRALSSWSVFRAFGALSEFAGSRTAATPDDCVCGGGGQEFHCSKNG